MVLARITTATAYGRDLDVTPLLFPKVMLLRVVIFLICEVEDLRCECIVIMMKRVLSAVVQRYDTKTKGVESASIQGAVKCCNEVGETSTGSTPTSTVVRL